MKGKNSLLVNVKHLETLKLEMKTQSMDAKDFIWSQKSHHQNTEL